MTLSLCRAHYVIICEHVFACLEVFLGGRGGQYAIAICNVCSARILRGGKKASSFNTTNLISHLKGRHRGEAVLRDFKWPPLLERQWYSNIILRVRDFNCYFVAFYCNRLLWENSCFAYIRSCCLKSLYNFLILMH